MNFFEYNMRNGCISKGIVLESNSFKNKLFKEDNVVYDDDNYTIMTDGPEFVVTDAVGKEAGRFETFCQAKDFVGVDEEMYEEPYADDFAEVDPVGTMDEYTTDYDDMMEL